jgi:hypothetical protein
MPYIIGVNPVKKRAKRAKATKKPVKRKVKTAMPKKKRTTKRKPSIKYRTRTKTIKVYRSKPKRRAAKRVYRRGSTEALQLSKVFRAAGAVSIGMVIAKVAVNKLTEGGSEKVAWTWPNIFMAAGSSVVAAFILGAFGVKKPTVALIAVGGIGLALYKTFTCKIASRWAWSESWFGADEVSLNPNYLGEEIDVVDYEPGSVVGYIPGVGATDAGGQLVPYNPNMGATNSGGQVVPYNPNLGAGNIYQQIGARARGMYRNSYAGAM